jgi:hypothetical protein
LLEAVEAILDATSEDDRPGRLVRGSKIRKRGAESNPETRAVSCTALDCVVASRAC